MNIENMTKEQIVKAMKDRHNGCPLFDGREKGSLDDLTNSVVTIEDIFKLSGDDGDYHAITFVEDKEHTYLTAGGLKSMCDEFGEHVVGVKIEILPMIKTKANRTYRPIKVIG
jgi:hypothetical protein